jgi:hypothetical protein
MRKLIAVMSLSAEDHVIRIFGLARATNMPA